MAWQQTIPENILKGRDVAPLLSTDESCCETEALGGERSQELSLCVSLGVILFFFV